MKLGLFGGSFNPIHRGHLAIARAARAALGLDRVVLIPSARPPHKAADSMAPAEDRLAMTRLAAAGDPHLEVSDVELARSGPSYTIDTVRAFQAQHPGAEVYFVIGADSVPELETWRNAKELVRLARFAVAARPGVHLEDAFLELERELGGDAAKGIRARVIPIEPDPVSATEVRRRVARGEPIDGLVPDAVRDYILSHGLYRAKEPTR